MESLVHILIGNALAATFLAVVAASAGRIFQRPAVTHSLWLIVLLKLITPPLIPFSLPGIRAILPVASSLAKQQGDRDHEAALQTGASTELHTQESERVFDWEPSLSAAPIDMVLATVNPADADLQLRSSDLAAQDKKSVTLGLPTGWRWEPTVFIVIMAGAVGWWGLAIMRIIQFRRLLRDMRPVPEELQSHTDELAERMGLGQRPVVCLVPGRVPPMLWAIGGQPRLLAPAQLWATMGEEERTSLLLHELAHLKRRDHWVRWLELLVGGLYWWHPVLWWSRRALREAEEHCCDAWVVWAMPRRARTYAAALLAAVEFVSGARTTPVVASATSGSGHFSCLKRRLRMIVRAKTQKSLSWAGRIAMLGVAAILLPLAPSLAQKSTLAKPAVKRSGQHSQDNGAKYQSRPIEVQPDGDQLVALLTNDDDKAKDAQDKDDDDDDKEEKARDAAEHFQQQLQDLIGKIGKQFGPVTEEIRKALDRAVGEVHKSLDKENLSVEDLGKALEKSQEELKKAFEGGGPVDKELREAFEHSRNELHEALERGKAEVQDQVESLRERSRELTDRAQESLERAKKAAEKDATRDDEPQANRQELEAARQEIRQLEQQLRRSTRRLEDLERRQLRRGPAARRERIPRATSEPEVKPVPPAEPASPERARQPNAPAAPARPARPNIRRPQPPPRLGPGPARRGPQGNNERRIQELEEKMKSLLKELENLKEEKPAPEKRESGSRDSQSTRSGLPISV